MENPPYLNGLNPEQLKAVLQTEGPVMIIAGAGSGKTRVLTYRIAHLIRQEIPAFNILALTFTNKAAKEMQQRIYTICGAEAKNLWMGTFHAVFAKILRFEADRLNYPSAFTIYDTDDSKSLIKTIIKELNLDADKVYKPSVIYSRISNCKNNLINPAAYIASPELMDYDFKAGRGKFYQIYQAYVDRCFKAGAMDFDDLLLNTDKLFRLHPDVLLKYQHKFKYIMVDEYQDTNVCQYSIIKRLAAAHENICVVGDDAQSIYSFRGATIKNILSFQKDYYDAKVFKLEQNYRSTKNIVLAAGHIIANNKEQLEKTVWTDNDSGEKISVVRAVTDNEEGRIVAQSIFEQKMQNQMANSDFAILYRTNSQSRSFEEALRKLSVPYRIYGGTSFYQRKEIKDMIAYLRLIVNPNDEEALKRIINYPSRKIGASTIDRLILIANQTNQSIFDVVCTATRHSILGKTSATVYGFGLMIQSFRTMLESHNAHDLAYHVAKQVGLLTTLHTDKTVEGISRYENLIELLNGIKEFVEDDTSELDKDLPTFLQDIALLTDADKKTDEDKDKVSLMTIHASKGLEFPSVFVVGLEENLFPSQMSLGSRQDLEEERRLFYVAITRAEKKLSLSFATSRFRFGSLLSCEPSRFIEEIDKKYIEMATFKGISPLIGLKKELPTNTTAQLISSLKRNMGGKTLSPKLSSSFIPEDLQELAIGDKVEHNRFGYGEVILIEGEGGQKRASINFDDFGAKVLVLSFAKLRIIK